MSRSIRAVDRALDVLMCFTNQTPELNMTQISEKVGINKSTIHRLLATLEGKRFVERDPVTGNYRPGIRLIQIAYFTLEHNNLLHLAAPFLKSLSKEYSENINLSVLDDTEVVYLEIIESSQRVKLAAARGQRLPAFCTASGKVILAFLPEDQVISILERGMPRFSKNTITSKETYFENLKRTREQGFAISDQEYEEGINAIAAPIINSSGKPIASISVAGPAYRLTRERMIEIGPNLIATTKKIAREVELAVNLE